ncbi:MAG: hypothetical protein II956_09235 [Bacteroidales bacterium]|nr:hypothetical protein [Bacteroidales bacterium]
MKRLTLLAAAFAFAFNASAQADLRCDWSKLNLKGNNVKSLTETSEGATPVSYTFNDMGYLTNSGQQYTFDSKGNLTMSLSPDGKGMYEYNSKGLLTEYILKNGDSMYRETYVYDGSGKMTSCTTSNSTITFTYDNSGNLIHSNDTFGNLLSEYVYKGSKVSMEKTGGVKKNYAYDSKGRTSSVTTEKDGQKTVETFSYDENDAVVKRIVTISGNGTQVTETHNYTVDTTGNWVKDDFVIEKGGAKTTGKIVREIEYFGPARRLFLLK